MGITMGKYFHQFKKIFIFFIFLELLLASFIYFAQKEELAWTINKNTQHAESDYKQLYTSLKIHANTIFNEMINQEEVLKLFKEATNPDKSVRDSARKKLYFLLLEPYQRLNTQTNLRQLHFHTPKNRSFLRMHKPDRYGDDLTGIRKSVTYVNRYRKAIDGFEEGRVLSGFRFVYPLYYNHEYLGSVETSFAAYALRSNLKTEAYDVCVIIKKEEVSAKIDQDEKENYTVTKLSDKYLREKDVKPSILMNKELIKHIKKQFQEKEHLNKSFSIYSHLDDGTLFSFLPIRSVNSSRYVGYIIFIKKEDALYFVSNLFLLMQVLCLLVVLSFLYFTIKRETLIALIKEKNETFNSINRNTRDAVIIFRYGRVVDCNISAYKQAGLSSKEQFIGYSSTLLSPFRQPNGQKSSMLIKMNVVKALKGEYVNFDWMAKRLDGSTFWTSVVFTRIDINGKGYIHAHFRDISHHMKAQEIVERERTFLQNVIDSIDSSIRVINKDSSIELMNKKALQNVEDNLTDHISSNIVNQQATSKSIFEHNNSVYETVTSPLFNEKSEAYAIIETVYDITNLTKANEEIAEQIAVSEYKATHDTLTSLANKSLLVQAINHAISNQKNHAKKIAILLIDLDNFKEINDSLGHDFGDKVLLTIANRLAKATSNKETLARLGGDEFILLLENNEDLDSIAKRAQKVLEQIKVPIHIDNHEIFITMSIGISICPDDASNAENLLKNADAAMYKAKANGKDIFEFYSKEMTIHALERITLEAQLRKAITNNEFVVHYQAQVDSTKHKIIGLEALIRWIHPSKGVISPFNFIPLAEETGLIVDIDYIVAENVFAQARTWLDKNINFGVISINLSMIMLQRGRFIEKIKVLLDKYALDPKLFQFEITETQIMMDVDKSIHDISLLKELGFSIAIDDFGTGYSSLAYLKKLPIDKLKIDKSFIDFIPRSEEDNAIVKAIIALANSLKLHIIAEGVEELEQERFLNENGCHEIQGYLYSKPINSVQASNLLENWE